MMRKRLNRHFHFHNKDKCNFFVIIGFVMMIEHWNLLLLANYFACILNFCLLSLCFGRKNVFFLLFIEDMWNYSSKFVMKTSSFKKTFLCYFLISSIAASLLFTELICCIAGINCCLQIILTVLLFVCFLS